MAENETKSEIQSVTNGMLKWALLVLFSWFVYEAREIKADVKTLLIQRALDDQRNDNQDAEIIKIWAVIKENETLRSVEMEPGKRKLKR